MNHMQIDQRSLYLHRLVAEKLRREPWLFDNARATLARWRTIVAPNSQPYLREWERIFDMGMDAALAVATERSERADALRQSSSFCGILTNQERIAFFRQWRPDEA